LSQVRTGAILRAAVRGRVVSAVELCRALLHDSEEERVICIREPSIPSGAMAFICRNCFEAMLDGRAVRMEHMAEEDVDSEAL